MPPVAALLLTLALLTGAQALDLAERLGAHPWWATQVIWIGALVGLMIAAALWALRLSVAARLGIALLALVLGYTAASFGKTAFAASFGENRMAGQFWHFGWIATCAAFTALPLALASRRRS